MANANIMSYVASAATWVNSIISLPFQIDSCNKVMQGMVFKRHTFAKINSETTAEKTTNPLQKEAATLRKIETVTATTATVLNGLGQGCLNTTGIAIVENKSINEGVVGGSAFFYSSFPNYNAAAGSIAQTQVMSQEVKSTTSPSEEKNSAKSSGPKFWRFIKPEVNSSQYPDDKLTLRDDKSMPKQKVI
jgi:hypothetical protein